MHAKAPTLYTLLCIGSIASCFVGYFLCIYNTSLSTIAQEFQVCGNAIVAEGRISFMNECDALRRIRSQLNYSFFASAACGSLIAQSFLKKFGRRKSLMIIYLVVCLGQFASFQAQSMFALISLRLLIGIAVGLATVIPPIYMTEMVPSHLKFHASLLPAICTTIGSLMGLLPGLWFYIPGQYNSIATFTPQQFKHNSLCWRSMMFVPCPLAGICFLLLCYPFSYDTPDYLRSINLQHQAEVVEMMLHGSVHEPSKSQLTHTNPVLLRTIPYTHQTQFKRKHILKQLRLILTQYTMRIVPNSYLRLSWTLAVLQQCSGITIYMTMSTSVFKSLGLSPILTLWSTIGMAILSVVCAFLSPFVMMYLQRRTALVQGYVGLALSHCVVVINLWFGSYLYPQLSPILSIAMTLTLIAIYGCTTGPILFLYLNELLPQDVKDVGLGVSFFFNWMACYIVTYIFQIIDTDIYKFLILFVACLVGAAYSYENAPETKHIEKFSKSMQSVVPT